MSESGYVPIEELPFFKIYIMLSNRLWQIVSNWKQFEKETIGKQMVRAADSIGANLVEGDGRYSGADAVHFFVIARVSARETRYWIERSKERNLIDEQESVLLLSELTLATRQLNGIIKFRRASKNNNIREESVDYCYEEPADA